MYHYFMINNKIFECICHKDKTLVNWLDLWTGGLRTNRCTSSSVDVCQEQDEGKTLSFFF